MANRIYEGTAIRDFPGVEYVESAQEHPCFECGAPTTRIEINFEAPLCSTECLWDLEDAFWEAVEARVDEGDDW